MNLFISAKSDPNGMKWLLLKIARKSSGKEKYSSLVLSERVNKIWKSFHYRFISIEPRLYICVYIFFDKLYDNLHADSWFTGLNKNGVSTELNGFILENTL